MKKILTLILCFAMLASMLAACGGGDDEKKGADAPAETNADGRKVISVGVLEHANCTDYDNNKFTMWLEEQAGVDLEFVIFPGNATDAASKLGTWIAVGEELPDILWNIPLDTSVYNEYGEDEYLLDLKPYFDDKEGKSKVFWDRMEEVKATSEQSYNTTMRRLVNQDTGAMYGFPMVQTTMIDSMDYQVYINQQWLDTLNLDMPTDPESLFTVLEAFRDGDPNGNGQADEIPLLGASGSLSGDTLAWIMNMFLYIDDTHWFNVDENGKLYLPHTTQEYREALAYVNRLMDANLLPDSYFSMGWKDLKALVNTADGETARVGVWAGHPTLICEINNFILEQYTAMPMWGNAIINEIAPQFKTFISADCQDPDKAWEILMLMASKEGGYRMYYGEKGVDWDDADEGTKSYMDLDAEIKVINNITQAIGSEMWKTLSACILIYAEHELSQQPAEEDPWLTAKQTMIKDCYDKYQAAQGNNPTTVVPTLVYTTDEAEAIADQRTNCQSYLNQMRSFFCVGSKDVMDDGDWDAYLKELDKMGLQKWIDAAQKVYDRQLAE